MGVHHLEGEGDAETRAPGLGAGSGFKPPGLRVEGKACAAILDGEPGRPGRPLRAEGQRDRGARRGSLHGVVEQAVQGLLQEIRVDLANEIPGQIRQGHRDLALPGPRLDQGHARREHLAEWHGPAAGLQGVEVAQQGPHPAIELIGAVHDALPGLAQLLRAVGGIDELRVRADARQGIADVVGHHGHQRAEGGLALARHQGVAAGREIPGQIAEGPGQIAHLRHALLAHRVCEVAPAEAAHVVHQGVHGAEEVPVQPAQGEGHDQQCEGQGQRVEHRRQPGPGRELRLQGLLAGGEDGAEHGQGALEIGQHPLLLGTIQELHAGSGGDLEGVGEDLVHVGQHHPVGIAQVAHRPALVLVPGQPVQVREAALDALAVRGVLVQHGGVLGEAGPDGFLHLAVHVTANALSELEGGVDAKRFRGAAVAVPGRERGHAGSDHQQHQEGALVEQEQALEGVGKAEAHGWWAWPGVCDISQCGWFI